MKKLITLVLVLMLALVGCYAGPKESVGTLLGAGGGAVLGSQVGGGTGRLVAVGVGTLAGALLGQEVGRSLDRADQLAMERNAQYSLEYAPTRTTTNWRNPDSGNYGSITPVETYQTAQGQYCREYHQNIVVGGEAQRAFGTACRQPDGTWRIIR